MINPLIFLLVTLVTATLEACSNQNIGTLHTSYQYMSNGWCHDYCNTLSSDTAIVQGSDCWCSNDTISRTVSDSNCETVCPGFPPENCAGNGYFGYIFVNNPVGTSNGASSSTKSSSSSTSTNPATTLITQTTQVTQTHQQSTVVESTVIVTISTLGVTHSSSSNQSSTSSVSFKSDNTSASPIIKTEFVSLSATSLAALTSSSASGTPTPNKKNNFFDSKGKVAGTFTAVGIVVVGLILGVLYCCLCAGGGADDDDGYSDEERYSLEETSVVNDKTLVGASASPPSKSGSLSSSDLKRQSSGKTLLALLGREDVTRSTSKKKLKGTQEESLGPDSMMFPITELDARLDPKTMFLDLSASNKSLNDEVDYSRRILLVVNP